MVGRIMFFTLFTLTSLQGMTLGDSLISVSQVSFSSDLEKSIFERLSENESDYFPGLLLFSGADEGQKEQWRRSYEAKLKELRLIKKPKKNEKYVKKVYEFVHDEFLRKYEAIAYFHQIFQNGVYNCVSACALYALVFEDLGIPFTVKETPTHVYIVAYPESEQIGIETTDPIGGFKTFSLGFREAFVGQLADLKLIDRSELNADVNVVFNKYYFTDSDLGAKELIGIQYYNHGISNLQEQKYYEAFLDFQKAYILHPTEQIGELVVSCGILAITTVDYNEWADVELLGFISTMNHPSVGNAEVLGEFSRLLNNQLIKRNDTQFVARAYRLIREKARSDELKSDLDFYYNYENGRKLYNKGSYKKSFPYVLEAFAANPSNQDAENLLVSNINNATVAHSFSSDEILELLEQLYADYPELNSNAHLGSLRMNLYLEAMRDAYIKSEVEKAKMYKKRFEENVEQYKYSYYEHNVGKAYSQGVSYYFKKGWYQSARQVLNEGLKFAPHNQELKMRKYWLDRAQN